MRDIKDEDEVPSVVPRPVFGNKIDEDHKKSMAEEELRK